MTKINYINHMLDRSSLHHSKPCKMLSGRIMPPTVVRPRQMHNNINAINSQRPRTGNKPKINTTVWEEGLETNQLQHEHCVNFEGWSLAEIWEPGVWLDKHRTTRRGWCQAWIPTSSHTRKDPSHLHAAVGNWFTCDQKISGHMSQLPCSLASQ